MTILLKKSIEDHLQGESCYYGGAFGKKRKRRTFSLDISFFDI